MFRAREHRPCFLDRRGAFGSDERVAGRAVQGARGEQRGGRRAGKDEGPGEFVLFSDVLLVGSLVRSFWR